MQSVFSEIFLWLTSRFRGRAELKLELIALWLSLLKIYDAEFERQKIIAIE